MTARSLTLLRLITGLAVSTAAFAATYEVGPSKPYTTIGSVPWATLAPGDTVLIYARPTPYREKWVICRQGTAAQPITVRGVADASGNPPVIDGTNAVGAPGVNYWNQERGIIKIGGANIPADLMPKYIIIDGLDVANATNGAAFTGFAGDTRRYSKNSASIFVEKGENITIRNCRIHGSGNGLFVASNDTETSRAILIEGNYIYGNGNVGSYYEHNSYTAAAGITLQFNHYGPLRSGAIGNSLKDRSSGSVIRYNWIDSANRQLDLVDAEDSIQIRNAADYRQTFVYGNVLFESSNSGNSQILHYGGDSGNEAIYRKGTLYFYNNTVISGRSGHTTLARLSSNSERMDARNNIIYSSLNSGFSILDDTGAADLTRNWMSTSWVKTYSGNPSVVNDLGGNITGSSPGFANEGAQDFRLAPNSAAINGGGLLNPAAVPSNDLTSQYLRHQAIEPRSRLDVTDIGAFEFSGTAIPPADTQPPTVAMIAPLAGIQVAGLLNVTGVASDLLGITRVECYVNGQLKSTSNLPAFNFTIDTSTMANGLAVINIRAYDTALNIGQATVSVNVNNAAQTTSGPATQNFSYGLNGYLGAADIGINNTYPGNSFPTTAYRHRASLSATSSDRVLLKFNGINVPPGNRVVSATLTMGYGVWASGVVLDGYYLSSAWDENSPLIGWLQRTATAQWLSPGASAADRIPGKTFRFSGMAAIGDQTATVALDPAVVQQWIDSPASNQGVEITNSTMGTYVFVYSWRNATANLRPMLTIVSAPAGNSVSINSPAQNAVVAGSTSVQASAASAPSRLEMWLDGQLKSSVPSQTLSLTWDTTQQTNGVHTIAVRAYDVSNQFVESARTVTVNNVAAGGQAVTAFVNGSNSYASASDVFISSTGGGNGRTFLTERGHVDMGSSTGEGRMLVQFANLSIPAGQHVTAATLQIGISSYYPGFKIQGSYLSSAWDSTSPNIGWLYRDSALPWLSAGAGLLDQVAGNAFEFPVVLGTGDQTLTVQLSPAVVQGWITNPASNAGVELTNPAPVVQCFVYSSRSTNLAMRPVLTITSAP